MAFADVTPYVGAGYSFYHENVTNENLSADANMAVLKIGYGERKTYTIEFSLDYIDNNKNIAGKNDGVKYGFNVDLIKAFDFDIYVLPYFKVGLGMGKMLSQADIDGDLTYGSFNLGAGFFIPFNQHFDIELGYDYRYLSYEKLNEEDSNYPKTHVNIGYLGINYRF